MDGVRHDYVYASGQLLRESYTENGTSYTLDFLYDQSGRPYILYLTTKVGSNPETSSPYYYLLNLQGDVVALVTASGTKVAAYSYDPYGALLTATGNLADLNPLRYRGYYYDAETGFYYLQSIYYDPALGRFLNTDSYASTGQGFLGYNMFAYCGNSPVLLHDSAGTRPKAYPLSDSEILGDECDYGMWFVGGFGTDGTSALSPEINPTPPVNPGGSGFGATLGKIAALVGVAAEVGNCIAPAAYPNNPDNKDETKKRQEYFPDDPNLFMPIGLVRRDYPGTDNGSFIKWTLPLLKKEVIFEWDEDFVNGSHYHVMLPGDNGKHNGTHYYAGDPVPEPWNTLFFGG